MRETVHSTISGWSDDALLRKFMCFQTASKKDNILSMYQEISQFIPHYWQGEKKRYISVYVCFKDCGDGILLDYYELSS